MRTTNKHQSLWKSLLIEINLRKMLIDSSKLRMRRWKAKREPQIWHFSPWKTAWSASAKKVRRVSQVVKGLRKALWYLTWKLPPEWISDNYNRIYFQRRRVGNRFGVKSSVDSYKLLQAAISRVHDNLERGGNKKNSENCALLARGKAAINQVQSSSREGGKRL